MKNKIIIVGYPKSGNTWLTRLVAELVGCPVKGFLYRPQDTEIAHEGENRKSNSECYNSHHQWSVLTQKDRENAKIIYVIRDPRDVSLSGRSYFYRRINWFAYKYRQPFIFLDKILNDWYYRLWGAYHIKNQMNKALLWGGKKLHYWCRISWKAHLMPFWKEEHILKVKYEDLLAEPLEQSQRILTFLGLQKTENFILQSIENQSFSNVKNKLEEAGKTGLVKFMRKGKAEQWSERMSKKEQTLFATELEEWLNKLEYKLY